MRVIFFFLNFLVLFSVLSACDQWPRDPEHTMDQIHNRGFIRAGITHNPPWTEFTETDTFGLEAFLLRELADSLGVGVIWFEDAEHELLEQLSRYELDVVLGGLQKSLPSLKEVGTTRPYLRVKEPKKKNYVLAVPPGENRWLVTLDTYLQGRRSQIERDYYQKAGK